MVERFQYLRKYLTLRTLVYVLLVTTTLAGAYLALIVLQAPVLNVLGLSVGDVAPQDVVAPYAITFESQVLTNQQREQAIQTINPVYTAPDPRIARQQVDDMQATFTYISVVRADTLATPAQKLNDLSLVQHYTLSPEIAQYLLAVQQSQWETIQTEALLVLQQVMRSVIRETQLEDARRSVPTLVSLSLPDTQAQAVAQLVTVFIAPNSFYSEELTAARRQAAQDGVIPVLRSFARGETVVQRGKVVTAVDIEALNELGLLSTSDQRRRVLTAATLLAFCAVFTLTYIHQTPLLRISLRRLSFLSLAFLVFLVGARMIVLGHVVLPYLFPLATFGMLISSLMGMQTGMILMLPLSLLVTFEMANPLELAAFYLLGGMFGILILGPARRIPVFFGAALGVASIGAAVILAYRVNDPFTDMNGIATLLGASLINGFASAALTLVLQFLGAQFLHLTTPLQLMELSRPDQPLLRQMLTTAPGTYQHSLQVANLAEQAAELIGADALLTRVGALYHDVGKMNRPLFFIENQLPGSPNPHDKLDPETSAGIIIGHVVEGYALARSKKLPVQLCDFILEHHGTMVTRYQYIKAVQAATDAGSDPAEVDETKFRYPGPRPRSRETALVMLADGSEARARAERPKDEEALRAMVKNVVENRLAMGELDETNLTTADLNTIIHSFTTTLRGIYHPRIEYPKLDQVSAIPPEKVTPSTGEPSAAEPVPVLSQPPAPAPQGETPLPSQTNKPGV